MLHHLSLHSYSGSLFQEIFKSNFLTRCLTRSASKKTTHYEVLGIKTNASPVDIREAFVRLSKEIHPDRNPDDPENHAKFVRLNEAYTTLSKSMARQEYDINLAYWLHVQETTARNASSTHSAGSSSAPGSAPNANFYESNQQERVFWDETIYQARDRRKDAGAFYPEDRDRYYGIKGLRRQSNISVAVACCAFILLLGTGYFLIALKYSERKRRERYERVDRVNMRLMREIKERARINGTAKQLEILAAKQEAREKETKERIQAKINEKSDKSS